MELLGVYTAKKTNGEVYYRASITYKNKHISLGSYDTALSAHKAYCEASKILLDKTTTLHSFPDDSTISFEKWVLLHNFRDNGYYFKTPIYLRPRYFSYYLDIDTELVFDVDDLFYYSNHKIMRRDGYFFVNDYGMQINIRSRYGIKNFAVLGRDYLFKDNNPQNFRYENILIINKYIGVNKGLRKSQPIYTAKIHINGDFIIGRYSTENKAAIAYNKAVDLLYSKGVRKEYTKNYIEDLSKEEYIKIYKSLKISRKLTSFSL